MLIAISLLIFLSNSVCAEKITMGFELENTHPNCKKYLQNTDNPDLEITHARYLVVNNATRQIKTNVFCEPDKSKSSSKMIMMNCQTNQEFFAGLNLLTERYIIIAVRTKNQMMSSQIEYRYNEKQMKMYGYLKPEVLKAQKFKPTQHLFIGNITLGFNDIITDHKISFSTGCFNPYPDTMIADHGIYATRHDVTRSERPWQRIYFDPDGVGESFIVEDL